MTIRIISVGKRHDPTISSAIEVYATRLQKYAKLEWVLVPPVHSPNKEQQIDYESTAVLAKIKSDDYVVLLDETGNTLTTPSFAARLEQVTTGGRSTLTFIIGGAYGVNEATKQRADYVWSLSPLVFPHQLVRLIVTEQLCRSFSLLAGHPYHHQ